MSLTPSVSTQKWAFNEACLLYLYLYLCLEYQLVSPNDGTECDSARRRESENAAGTGRSQARRRLSRERREIGLRKRNRLDESIQIAWTGDSAHIAGTETFPTLRAYGHRFGDFAASIVRSGAMF